LTDDENTTQEPAAPLLDGEGAARLLGISPRTVEAWVRQRRIPFVKLGSGNRALTRFRPEALRAWIEAQEVPAAGAAEGNRAGSGGQA
jgi:excisionase family DNA binding protein